MEKSVNFGGIVVTRVYTSQYQKAGTVTAELKQSVNTRTKYAGALGTDDNLFSASDFSELESPEYKNTETRVYWMNVPAGSTVQDVQLRLQNATNAKLVKVLSNRPIISNSQDYAISKGLTSEEDIATSQVVKDPDGNLIRRDGELCFKKIVFSLHGGEDENIIHENAYELSSSLMG